jgi:hypothetical protein
MLAALEQAASTSGTAAINDTVLGDIAAKAAVTDPATTAKTEATITLSTLQAFLTTSSTTVRDIAAAIAQTGTNSANPAPDAVVAALDAATRTTGSTLIEYISQGTVSDTNITSLVAYGGTDGYITHLATDLESSNYDTTYVATGLANYDGITPESVATDMTTGAGSKQAINIAQTLSDLFPSQSANIAGAVSAVSALTDATRLKVAEGVLSSLATSGSLYAAAVSGSVSATDTVQADKAALASKVAPLYSATAAAIADAVAKTNSADVSFANDDLVIAEDVAKAVTASTVLTATSVEEIVLNGSADPVVTGTSFANGFVATLPAVVGIASTAASGLSALTSGTIGLAIDSLSKVVTVPALTGSVALAVADAASAALTPGGLNFPGNFPFYTVAGVIGSGGGVSKLPGDFSAIAGALAGPLLGQTGVNGAENQGAAAIAYDLANQLLQLGSDAYNKTNIPYIEAVMDAVIAQDPEAAAIVYGYVAEAVKEAAQTGALWTAAHSGGGGTNEAFTLAALLTDAQGAVTTAESGDSALATTINNNVVIASGTLSLFATGGSATLSTAAADETPTQNF